MSKKFITIRPKIDELATVYEKAYLYFYTRTDQLNEPVGRSFMITLIKSV